MSINIQTANFWKRFSAWMVDVVLVVVLGMFFALITTNVIEYDHYYEKYDAIMSQYQAEYDVNLTEEEYNKLPETQKAAYDEREKQMEEALNQDEEAVRLVNKISSLIIVNVCISAFLSITVVHFVVPLLWKNGRTVGKKIFGLAVVRSNGVKLTAPVLFVRTLIGLFAMETLAVFMLFRMGVVGVFAALAVQVLQIYVMFKTETNSSIHDLLADTVVVDFSSQRIFETQEEFLQALQEEKETDA